jgi:methylamine dehydrogenase heavy chain
MRFVTTGKLSGAKLSAATGLLLALLCGTSAARADAPAVPEAEQAETSTISPPKPGWLYVRGGWNSGGTRIFDTATGKMVGMVETSRSSDMAIDPAGKYYFVSETIWTKSDRGTRQDMISIYDSTELKLQAEVPMPGRILIDGNKHNFVLSGDGKTAYVFDLDPASSVNVVDLAKRKFVRNIELPGCADLIPNPGVGFSALCGDGTLATVAITGAKQSITHTAPFFSATGDPIFDNFAYDKGKGAAVFVSYTGLVYTAKIGATPTVDAPFSLQAAAGIRPGETKPLDVNWYPGGTQPVALHKASGHLFVLMHMGEFWTQKASGSEVWELDIAAKKVVKRIPIKDEANNIEVTQEAEPRIVLSGERGLLQILDPRTGEVKFKIENGGGGLITVVDPL